MDEYINREAARPDAFCSGVSCLECPFLTSPLYGGCRIDDFIASLPSADVVERKRGKWEKHNDGIMYWWDCSECHHDAWYDEDDLYNFCPNCGADMRGEDNGM